MKGVLVVVISVCFIGTFCGLTLAASTATVAVSATVVGSCGIACERDLKFTLIDQGAPSPDSTSMTVATFACSKGVRYAISDNDGLNSGSQALTNSRGDIIPYAMEYAKKEGGSGVTESTIISATIQWGDYRDVTSGVYSDTVVLNINY